MDMEVVDRSIPQEMKDLIRLALETGLDTVSIGYESIGSDFNAPIGWQLHMDRLETVERADIRKNFLSVTTQISSPDPTAYVGDRSIAANYLDFDEIKAWITAPREGIAEYTDAEKAQFSKDADLFLEAISNGWEAQRELRRYDAENLEKHMPETSPHAMVVKYTYTALNWHFNEDGHSANRSTGVDVSERMSVIKRGLSTSNSYYSAIGITKVDESVVLGKLKDKAPWFVPVAYHDDALEEWIK